MMGSAPAWLAACGSVSLPDGCGAASRPYRAGDTTCLTDQAIDFHVPMCKTVGICSTPKPDLTGNRDLQFHARE